MMKLEQIYLEVYRAPVPPNYIRGWECLAVVIEKERVFPVPPKIIRGWGCLGVVSEEVDGEEEKEEVDGEEVDAEEEQGHLEAEEEGQEQVGGEVVWLDHR